MDDVILTKLLCALLGGIPGWIWSETDPYPSSLVGVYYGAIPDNPDRAVGVRIYSGEDPRFDPTTRRVQLRLRGRRGAPDGADELAGPAFTRLHELSRVGAISGISRTSMAPLGADKNGREERTENYIIILDNPEAST